MTGATIGYNFLLLLLAKGCKLMIYKRKTGWHARGATTAMLAMLQVFVLPILIHMSTAQASPAVSTVALDRFEPAVHDFEKADQTEMPAAGGTLFIGSSTFQHWRTLATEFHDFAAINRGFGGSTIPEINHYFDRLVLKYHPARIVFYAGTNDIADGHSGSQVAADFKSFVAAAHKKLPDTQIYFISMSMAPCRVQWADQYVEGNRLVQSVVKEDRRLHYIDVSAVMVDAQGKLHSEYFGPDHLHMNPSGYAVWVPVIRQALLTPRR